MLDQALHASIIKLSLAYTLLGAFIFTIIVTCGSLIGLVRFVNPTQQARLFTALIVELVTICLGTFVNILNLDPRTVQKDIQGPVLAQLAHAEASTQQIADKLNASVLDGLRPEAAALARLLIEKARVNDIDLRLVSGYRSKEQQEELYARGRTEPGVVVTNARVSVHNTGLAFDVGVFTDGHFGGDDQGYRVVGALGKQVGLLWGGDWKVARDLPHFETETARLVLREWKSDASHNRTPDPSSRSTVSDFSLAAPRRASGMPDSPADTADEVFTEMAKHFDPDAARDVSAVYQYDLTGSNGGRYSVSIDRGKFSIAKGVHASPNITITMDANDYLDMVKGKLTFQTAFMSGKLKIAGDMGLAMKMNELFPPNPLPQGTPANGRP